MTPEPPPSRIADAAPACPGCGYNLAGLTLPVACPECGRESDRKPVERSLTEHASRGFAWMGVQAVGAKVISTVGQIGIAYILVREDFGLAAIANAVYSLVALLQQAGLRQVLVNRRRAFGVWSMPAFGLSLSLGLFAAALMAGAAPVVGGFYDDDRLRVLILILAPCMILEGALQVPLAKAQIDLRFKFLAFMNGSVTSAQVVACLVFALAGMGAYSFALAVVVQAVARFSLLWWFIRPRLGRRLRVRRWKHLIGDSSLLIGASILLCIATALWPLVLGRIDSPEEAGLFTFALALSLQSVQLITTQLEGVLFATLSRLRDEPLRQVRAFLRATGVLALIVMPLCLLQAAAAEPAVRLVFPAKWYDAIVPLQLLSVGMAFLAATYSTNSLVQAQGRFGTFLKLAVFLLLTTVVCIVAAMWGRAHGPQRPGATAMWMAGAAAVQMLLYGIVALHRSIRPPGVLGGGSGDSDRPPGWADVVRVLFVPFLLSVAAIAPGYLLSRAMPDSVPGLIGQGLVIGVLSAAIYVPLARLVMPAQWKELVERLAPFVRRIPVVRSFV